MANGAARWRPCLQRNREVFLQSLLSNNRPGRGAALRLCWDLRQMAALRGSADAQVACLRPIWTTAKTVQVPAREDDGDGDGLPGRDRDKSVIILTAADVSIGGKQWNSCKCVKVAAAKISVVLSSVRSKHDRRRAGHPEHLELLTGELVVSSSTSHQQKKQKWSVGKA